MKRLVFNAIPQNLSDIVNHTNVAGIDRYKIFDNCAIPGKSFHIALHVINPDYIKNQKWEYSASHSHECDEINILLSESGCLKFQLELDEDCFTQESPSLIYIPSGVKHRSEAISGVGIFICIRLDSVK